jgi:cell division septum initiation protein DivIVA
MSHLRTPGSTPEEQDQDPTQEPPRSPFAAVAGRFANWITGADQLPVVPAHGDDDPDPMRELAVPIEEQQAPSQNAPSPEPPSRFPAAPLGYNRAAVDEHIFGLERELSELRAARQPAISITEELERIGEQTASILVVAHDQAHETTRLAREQAEQCVADAAANAVAITSEAKERLTELDSETDAVWRERERLLDDVRIVSAALSSLADEASVRFPAAAEQVMAPAFGRVSSFDGASAPWSEFGETVSSPQTEGPAMDSGLQETEAIPSAPEPQPTEPFEPFAAGGADPHAEPHAHDEPDAHAHAEPDAHAYADKAEPYRGPQMPPRATPPGDTRGWLAGLEPPEPPTQ